MAQVIKAEPESMLAKDCLLKWWEVRDVMALWVQLTDEDSPRIKEIGPLHPLENPFGAVIEPRADYCKRVALGMLALSKEIG